MTCEYAVLHGTCTLLAGLPRPGKAEQTFWGLNGSSCVSRSRQLTWSCEGPPRYHLELGLFHLLELPSCIRLAYDVPRFKKHHGYDLGLSANETLRQLDSGNARMADTVTLTHGRCETGRNVL